VLRHASVDAFEQIAELRRRDRHHAPRRRPDEAATVQALREQEHALPIMPQHFDDSLRRGNAPAIGSTYFAFGRLADCVSGLRRLKQTPALTI
jgi:hypothetical protein